MNEFEISFVSFEFWFQFKPSLNHATRRRLASLSCPPPLTPGPPSRSGLPPSLFTQQRRRPCPMAGGHCRPPRTADHCARPPSSHLLLLHVVAPAGPPSTFSLSTPCHRVAHRQSTESHPLHVGFRKGRRCHCRPQ
jgi:hypothetical protein